MKKYFIVSFCSGHAVFVEAKYIDEAIILAQAKMIHNGLPYDVEGVRETRYVEDVRLTNFVA